MTLQFALIHLGMVAVMITFAAAAMKVIAAVDHLFHGQKD